jgi:hypothetical protein
MNKRFLIVSILAVAAIAAAGTAYTLYRPNSARLLSFRNADPHRFNSRPMDSSAFYGAIPFAPATVTRASTSSPEPKSA